MLLLALNFHSAGQSTPKDTSYLTLDAAEKVFLANNLELLAGKLGIESARALIRQSGLWDNPSLYLEQNIYNSSNRKYFDYGYSGENIVQVQQLFTLAGKRNKRVQLAQINSRLSEYQLYDLIRTLKFELRSSFYECHYTSNIISTYERELVTLRKNVAIFDTLNTKGIISLKEAVRLKAFLFSLESEKLELVKSFLQSQRSLSLLLNDSTLGYVVPVVSAGLEDSISQKAISLQDLITVAMENRADLKLYRESLNYDRMNLQYQKALAVPDLRLGANYDRQGNFIRNYTALSLQMDLPAWNRNQGNIAASRFKVDQSKSLLDLYSNQVRGEVKDAYFKTLETRKLYSTFDSKFSSQFDLLTEGVLKNYQKRNITVLEFIDFYESYKSSVAQINRLKQNVVLSIEEINFVTGAETIK